MSISASCKPYSALRVGRYDAQNVERHPDYWMQRACSELAVATKPSIVLIEQVEAFDSMPASGPALARTYLQVEKDILASEYPLQATVHMNLKDWVQAQRRRLHHCAFHARLRPTEEDKIEFLNEINRLQSVRRKSRPLRISEAIIEMNKLCDQEQGPAPKRNRTARNTDEEDRRPGRVKLIFLSPTTPCAPPPAPQQPRARPRAPQQHLSSTPADLSSTRWGRQSIADTVGVIHAHAFRRRTTSRTSVNQVIHALTQRHAHRSHTTVRAPRPAPCIHLAPHPALSLVRSPSTRPPRSRSLRVVCWWFVGGL